MSTSKNDLLAQASISSEDAQPNIFERNSEQYPSIVKLKEREKENKALIGQLQSLYNDYAQLLASKQDTKVIRQKIQSTENLIEAGLNETKKLYEDSYSRGVTNNDMNSSNVPDLLTTNGNMLTNQGTLEDKVAKMHELDEENKVLIMQQKSHYFQYWVLIGTIIASIHLTIKSYGSSSISPIENTILAIFALFIIYWIYQQFYFPDPRIVSFLGGTNM